MFDVQDSSTLNAKFSVKPGEHEHKKIGVRLHASDEGFWVKTLNNRNLVSVWVLPDNSSQFVRILDKSFLQYNKNDYLIPQHLVSEVKRISKTGNVRSFVNKLQKNSKWTKSSSSLAFGTTFRHLSNKPESLLILRASEALGEAGITGLSHPHMLPLYWFATQLPHASKQQPTRERRSAVGTADVRRSVCTRPSRNNCRGMCGFRCNCWRFVCGDCCYHRGCYQHDLCCRAHFTTTNCLLPFSFSCDHYPKYPACLRRKPWWG